MNRSKLFRAMLLALVGASCSAAAQPTSDSPLAPPPNGPRWSDPARHALTNATVHVSPTRSIDNATVLIADGRIERVGANLETSGYRVWDASGRHVYAGFIDAYVEIDAPAPDPDAPGAHWNELVTPQRTALDGDGLDDKAGGSLRELGFTACAISPEGGIFRGTSAVVSLGEPPDDDSAARPPVYRDNAYQSVAFETVRRQRDSGDTVGNYPNSQMGSIALIRQVLHDSEYQSKLSERDREVSPVFDTLADRDTPLLFDATDERRVMWLAPIAREFSRPAVVLGSGLEFKRLDAVQRAGYPIVLPLRYPETPDVSTFGKADNVDLITLMEWEQAPTNARRLDDAGLEVSLTTHRLDKKKDFHKNLRSAIEHGLAEDRALAMLTINPAQTLGVSDMLGTVEPGKAANLVVTDGPVFEKGSTILDVWIDGRRHEINAAPDTALAGVWDVRMSGWANQPDATITIKGKPDKPEVVYAENDDETKADKVSVDDANISFTITRTNDQGEDNAVVFSATRQGDRLFGQLLTPSGDGRHLWTASRSAASEPEETDADSDDETASVSDVPEQLGAPFGPYMRSGLPEQPDILHIVGATVWTCGPDGVIDNGEIVVENGRITYVGPTRDRFKYDKSSNYRLVDVNGKHVTPGMIDCHSHTGTYPAGIGVNESGQAVTAEVRIGDVFDPGHINWYRQLAGGTTSALILHGSANPIGGQSQTVKVRWGAPDQESFRFENAPDGIKFALGENVKQSNWGDRFNNRYPQTRMGVETLMRDRFNAAREYADAKQRAQRSGQPFHTDLELEALAEILAGQRRIHCHSYRQDEILMLCKLAQEYGFTIGTFQHVLEGYKIAEAIRDNAVGGSAFSDWWAFKVEVQDAIPHNGAIMHEVGVTVTFNSDSDELARRMNDEAAKAVRYGGLPPEEALKFVTINGAKQLGIDDRVGSIEVGKDADIVVWSADPLSSFSMCERVFIDGREYFSIAQDYDDRRHVERERHRITQKILAKNDRKKGRDKDDEEESDEPERRRSVFLAFDDPQLLQVWHLLNLGLDPTMMHRGDCGCGDSVHFSAGGQR